MLYGRKLNGEAHYFGNKLRRDIKFGAKRVLRNLHKVNNIAVPALALGGMGELAGGMKGMEALAKGLSRI